MEKVLEKIKELRARWGEILPKLDLTGHHQEIRELEAKTLHTDFWQDQALAQKITGELSLLQDEVAKAEEIDQRLASLWEMADLAHREHEDLTKDLDVEVEKLEREITSYENKLFLSGPYDSGGAIISIHSGQGGVEAMDWAAMLLRMYLRFFEKQGWPSVLLDESKGEEAGIKSATVEVLGRYGYGYLKGEAGTHRLVRQSPFNADRLRQTSFALVEVLPILPETGEVDIKPDEIKMETFRSSGAGGQNVQKVNSAVRLIHLPSGLAVSVQTERSQTQNKAYAMKILRAKLWQLEEAKRKGEIAALKGDYRPASWGNQIRSYVLHPYQLVKDLRTGYETADTEAILNGDLQGLIEAQLRS
jgi:peptide chain release factor 2